MIPFPGPDHGHPLLASGRDADVFALDDRQVLRRYREGGDVAAEATVMAYVGERGFPVPKVYQADGADLVLERLDGPTLLQALANGAVEVALGAELLADLHSRLHALPARLSTDPVARILHLDLHPGNVILSARGPVLIDWRNTTEGRPDLDVALTALILAEVAVGLHAADLTRSAQGLLTAFLAAAGGEPLGLLDRAVARRAADANLSAQELDRLGDAAARVVHAGAR